MAGDRGDDEQDGGGDTERQEGEPEGRPQVGDRLVVQILDRSPRCRRGSHPSRTTPTPARRPWRPIEQPVCLVQLGDTPRTRRVREYGTVHRAVPMRPGSVRPARELGRPDVVARHSRRVTNRNSRLPPAARALRCLPGADLNHGNDDHLLGWASGRPLLRRPGAGLTPQTIVWVHAVRCQCALRAIRRCRVSRCESLGSLDGAPRRATHELRRPFGCGAGSAELNSSPGRRVELGPHPGPREAWPLPFERRQSPAQITTMAPAS